MTWSNSMKSLLRLTALVGCLGVSLASCSKDSSGQASSESTFRSVSDDSVADEPVIADTIPLAIKESMIARVVSQFGGAGASKSEISCVANKVDSHVLTKLGASSGDAPCSARLGGNELHVEEELHTFAYHRHAVAHTEV